MTNITCSSIHKWGQEKTSKVEREEEKGKLKRKRSDKRRESGEKDARRGKEGLVESAVIVLSLCLERKSSMAKG